LKDVVIDTTVAAALSDHLSTGLRGEDPLVQLAPAETERIGLVLVGAGTKTVQGDAK
jgi:hypothetical protein